MATTGSQDLQTDVFGEVRKNWGWMLTLGILMVILGVIGLGMSVFLTIASVVFFGVLLLVGSGFQLVDAFKSKGWKSVMWQILMAIAYLIAGFVMISDPVSSGVMLTMVIAVMLVVTGTMRIATAFQMRPHKGWGWVAFSGALSILLGVMVFMKWPASGLWVIGMFVAIEMIIQGWSSIVIAIAARTAGEKPPMDVGASGAAPA